MQNLTTVDYRRLLKKYMQYIRDIEGYDFVTSHRRRSDVTFTEAEWAALERLAQHDQDDDMT